MSASRLAPVQLIAWTLSSRIICARESPSSAVLIAPASVTSIAPPESRWALYASDASTRLAALKWRKWCRRYSLTGPDFRVTVSLICLLRSSVVIIAWSVAGVGPSPGNRQVLPLGPAQVFGQEHDLSYMLLVVRQLAQERPGYGVRFPPNRNRSQHVLPGEGFDGVRQDLPTLFPHAEQLLGCFPGRLELGVAVTVGLLPIGGQEVTPTGAHVPGHVLDEDRGRVALLIQPPVPVVRLQLPQGCFRVCLLLPERVLYLVEEQLRRIVTPVLAVNLFYGHPPCRHAGLCPEVRRWLAPVNAWALSFGVPVALLTAFAEKFMEGPDRTQVVGAVAYDRQGSCPQAVVAPLLLPAHRLDDRFVTAAQPPAQLPPAVLIDPVHAPAFAPVRGWDLAPVEGKRVLQAPAQVFGMGGDGQGAARGRGSLLSRQRIDRTQNAGVRTAGNDPAGASGRHSFVQFAELLEEDLLVESVHAYLPSVQCSSSVRCSCDRCLLASRRVSREARSFRTSNQLKTASRVFLNVLRYKHDF